MRPKKTTQSVPDLKNYWSLQIAEVCRRLGCDVAGLTTREATGRMKQFGPNELSESQGFSRLRVAANQIKNPLLLLLVFAAAISALTGEWSDATIVLSIIAASVAVGYHREFKAGAAAAALQKRIHISATVLRDSKKALLPHKEIVPGDIIFLSAGSLVPADALVLEAADLYVSESVLTGESFPVQKSAQPSVAEAPLAKRSNVLFMGTNVRSGTGTALIVATGRSTQFGEIAHRLTLRAPETEFDRGIKRFGYLMTIAMLIMVIAVFGAHLFRGRPAVETLLFAIALAVGLSPELLPVILNVNLGRSAEIMAKQGVLVRHLNAIENLGSMNILCTDKTGTLTEGVIRLDGAYNPSGEKSSAVLNLAAVNAGFDTGLANLLDDAILASLNPDLGSMHKLAEIPFDFSRKRTSVIVKEDKDPTLQIIMKGAFHHVLESCSRIDGEKVLDATSRENLESHYDRWSQIGVRVLAVASGRIAEKSNYSRDDEHDLEFRGFLTFLDQPKAGASQAISNLKLMGVSTKVITGDNKPVAQYIARLIGLRPDRVLTGSELDELHDEALWHRAEQTDIFAEVDPNQKERIILSLKKMGHVVGFLGDGVNDAPAMHAADTSLSVDGAVDVAREAADFVLLEPDLEVIRRGVKEGRNTFANSLKYILTTTSANLGNMVSMAAASLFLPFLPLTAGQILLNNFLSDIPAVGLADDAVDPELVEKPRRWDIRFIGSFMIQFGVLSSIFDFITFGVLIGIFHAAPEEFRTGWFVESLLTELVIALVVRTRKISFQSKPGKLLLVLTIAVTIITFVIPYLPWSHVLGFTPLPIEYVGVLLAITLLYVLATELLKHYFYRRQGSRITFS